jgi:hypothetical protein
MRKSLTCTPSEPEQDNLLLEYRFDYREARPNRFATEATKTMKTNKVVRSSITETVRKSPKKKK